MSNPTSPSIDGRANQLTMEHVTKGYSLWQEAWRRMLRNQGAVLGMMLLVVLGLLTIFAPLLTTYNPVGMVPRSRLQPPSSEHWFGTDEFGRDVFTRVLYGGRISLQVGVIAVVISLLIGVPLGVLGGYYGRWIDNVVVRLIDLMLAFPGILLALLVIAILGPNLINTMIAIGISAAPTYARIIRGSVLQIKEQPFVEAAVQTGASTIRILFFHIFLNVLGPIVVVATLGVASAIISGAALSFLGLGPEPPTPEWGLMLSEGRNYLRYAWWISTFPGIAIMITVLSINLIGDGLRDALDPHMTP